MKRLRKFDIGLSTADLDKVYTDLKKSGIKFVKPT